MGVSTYRLVVYFDAYIDRNSPVTSPTDMEPIERELSRQAPNVELVQMDYLEGFPILGG